MSSRSAPTTTATGLPPAYDPHVHEPVALEVWEDAGLFHVGPAGDADPYSIVMPPPNVTAGLHLGHALNNTLQDVLIRYHRMRGLSSLWIPGTDHAGIATQTVVEKRLLAQGISRQEMGRQAFVDKTREWKDDYEAVIIDQLKEMGASCDWERVRFTMDQMCATAVRHAFFVLFRDGLIYRGKRLVNWDPASLTALADDEVDMEEVAGHMWYLRYPLADGSGHVTVATTRPETMLGDTAVALNPKDPRAADLEGKEVRLPIVDRVIPIIVDDHVVMADPDSSDPKAAYASGFLKVTPAHDPNDWEIGLRHDLPVVNVLGPDARISDAHGWEDVSEEARPLVGLSREDARQAVVDWFEANGLLEEVRDYTHSVGHSYRSHVPIEPWLSDQWYVAVTDDRFRGSALRAQAAHQQASPAPAGPDGPRPGDGGLTFFPSRYARTFQAWHENLRDWCISRQLWWGHQIPVWVRTVPLANAPPEVADADIDVEVEVRSRWVEAGAAHLARRTTADEVEEAVCIPPEPTLARLPRADGSLDEQALVRAVEAEGFERDPDVLDTWFSSALWPMSTMGWPWPEDHPETLGLLESYNPTSVLTTAREIITLWVSRMVMFNRYFLDGQLPFHHVFIHAMIQDGHGQKMSKSLGNGVDPRDIIHSHGADAMRFTLVQMTTDTQDVRMPVALIAPQTGETFEPVYESTPAGHIVAAPIQRAPSDPSLEMVSAYGQASGRAEPTADIPVARNTSTRFDVGRNFANKVWNATRFGIRRAHGDAPADLVVDIGSRPVADRWVVARLAETVAALDDAIASYQFNTYADVLYDFIWHDVCDGYLEAVKPTVDDDPEQQVVLAAVLDAVLRILHPVCPFVTETLWPHVSGVRRGQIAGVSLPASPVLAGAAWPMVDAGVRDRDAVALVERARELVGVVRGIRSDQNVRPQRQVTLHATAAMADLVEAADGLVQTLAGVGLMVPLDDERPAVASTFVFEGSEGLLSDLADDVDREAEQRRLEKLLDATAEQIRRLEGRLANEGYVTKADPALVQESRDQLDQARADHAAARAARDALGG